MSAPRCVIRRAQMSSHDKNGTVPARAHESARIGFAKVTLRSDRRADTLRFENAIRELDDVLECFRVAGPFDYLLKFIAADQSGVATD
ncbi:hypothetical protein CUJ91_31485 (plasmid) [Paraburkholderia graminis]|nr:hypothetical protein CUJ91_31485 [Paraburkholderia graminis]